MGWIFPTALKANMDSAPQDAPAHGVQRRLEELEQRILVSAQEPHGPGDAASQTVRRSVTEMMNIVRPR